MYTASGALAAAALLFLAACSLARSSAFFCFVASSRVKASIVAATSPYNSWRSSGLISPARAFVRRLIDEVASTGDWSGAAGVAAGVVGARRRVALRLPGAGSGGGASAGVIFLCFRFAMCFRGKKLRCVFVSLASADVF